ncbi:ejaculatory bulb-specific protein 3 [Bombus impatiens]|uniref:Ejaculatory bulb-specific protein 3 n=1 Tax=Bombus impatiens TaxID=132113 RepID=A0A6P3E0M6_BOMIM|nr:ejaculatory bulb-specific protein 3 [Bombus impatiens]
MKAMHQILICLFLVMTIAYALARPDDLAPNVLSKDLASTDKYPAKLDNINVDDILNSDRLLANYHKCLIGDGRCTAEGNEIRRILPEALATDCQKCTEKQSENIKKVAFFLITKKPELWDQLMDKYDPEKKYRSKYEEQVKKLGVAAN